MWFMSINIISPLAEESITILGEKASPVNPTYLYNLSSIYYEPIIKICQTHKEISYCWL